MDLLHIAALVLATCGSVLAAFQVSRILRLHTFLSINAPASTSPDPARTIMDLVSLAAAREKQGLAALGPMLAHQRDPLLSSTLALAIEGADDRRLRAHVERLADNAASPNTTRTSASSFAARLSSKLNERMGLSSIVLAVGALIASLALIAGVGQWQSQVTSSPHALIAFLLVACIYAIMITGALLGSPRLNNPASVAAQALHRELVLVGAAAIRDARDAASVRAALTELLPPRADAAFQLRRAA
ncbi:MAG: hypothetical protein SFZ23_11240 [Planctomycetota bacterium]|nr:hypothetical protein [Planctomycetota bacterium]